MILVHLNIFIINPKCIKRKHVFMSYWVKNKKYINSIIDFDK